MCFIYFFFKSKKFNFETFGEYIYQLGFTAALH